MYYSTHMSRCLHQTNPATYLIEGVRYFQLCHRQHFPWEKFEMKIVKSFTVNGLKMSVTNSMVILFTAWPAQLKKQLSVTAYGSIIQTISYHKVPGVTFNSLQSFTTHATAIWDKMRGRNKVLKYLTETLGDRQRNLVKLFQNETHNGISWYLWTTFKRRYVRGLPSRVDDITLCCRGRSSI